jgi:hypothetical protein
VRRISLDAAPPFASITSGESPTATAANRTRSASPAPQCALIRRLPPTVQPELLELAAKYLGPQLGLWIALGIEHKEADPTSVRVGR